MAFQEGLVAPGQGDQQIPHRLAVKGVLGGGGQLGGDACCSLLLDLGGPPQHYLGHRGADDGNAGEHGPHPAARPAEGAEAR